MASLGKAQQKASSYTKDLDLGALSEQIETLRDYVGELTESAGRTANRQLARARRYATDTAQDAEEVLKDNMAASLLIALGLGIVVGWLLRR